MYGMPIGYQALIEKLALVTLPHYRESYIASHGRGKTLIENQHEVHIYPKSYALKNENDLLEQLTFALKYDGVNLEIMSAIFNKIEKEQIIQYIERQPTSIYSRKIWFFYEFLTNKILPIKDVGRLKHVDLLDPEKYFTGSVIKSTRHAINNNLLGNRAFCPLIRRSAYLLKMIDLNLDVKVKKLLEKYDPHLIARACNYLYTKETMSSYQIEREQPDKSRIIRFVNLLQQASSTENLSKEKLIELQNIIVDPRFKDIDYRHTQNYVGENISPYFQKIHYISPLPKNVEELMQGLLDCLDKMLRSEVHAVISAAIISFGFVFIHPFEDGNGRIHRFLIHYILSKKHFVPADMIFPVSSVMLKNMNKYDAVLESFSKPLLDKLIEYELSDDGIMQVNQETRDYYSYIDYTSVVEYLFDCIEDAIHHQIESELTFLVSYDKTKKSIQAFIDMPDNKIDLFIKFVMQNSGRLSANKKEAYFSLLTEEEIMQLTEIVNETMKKSK